MIRSFHIQRKVRQDYDSLNTIFSFSPGSLFADPGGPDRLAHALNQKNNILLHPEMAVHAGELAAYALLDQIHFFLLKRVEEQFDTDIFLHMEKKAATLFGPDKTDSLFRQFAASHPPEEVYSGTSSPAAFLQKTVSPGQTGRYVLFQELILLFLASNNPSLSPYSFLFDASELKQIHHFDEYMQSVLQAGSELPSFGPESENLFDMLLQPIRQHPNDLFAQLDYIRTHWAGVLGELLERLLRTMDKLKEERKFRCGGSGEQPALTFDGGDQERFSLDQDWMPKTVLLAKSTLVWLHQLSLWYKKDIHRLDQIPDDELDILAHRGINSLWLIGIWRRSPASKEIKRLCGNPEAEASAYSLLDYEIEESLGGWEALGNLRQRCAERGIRLASDMVPNHTGIDSKWIEEHPDWFIQLDSPPFPGYTFSGPNLSQNSRFTIQLEDHYYDQTDASVVFLHYDSATQRTRYIYHGNDGTHMPWNDTAQLDFLNPELREAIIQTIIHVARNFPIIRFDAAMTLANRHIQRLWYPAPGSGGDIPSRAQFGLSDHDFKAKMPQEFWREVVDRLAVEAPDTLLLAEAFWMMEGYFVRSLGMHRVYNSAFMNMLKNEDNSQYRQTIKNTLAFDPEILQRFVNFMNNPDEETAVAQFGRNDKYFGVCTMMASMPGLPMFGHGQIEGFSEKYGMEYRRAYKDEQIDRDLVERHEREIFPLLRERALFASAANFRLYDMQNEHGHTEESVFAYSNQYGSEHVLMVYNNRLDSANGYVKTAVPYIDKNNNSKKIIRNTSLGKELGLHNDRQWYTLLFEMRSGLWFLRRSSDILHSGLHIALNGYQCQIFRNIQEVQDSDAGLYAQLFEKLGGSGTTNINRSLRNISLQPVHEPIKAACSPEFLKSLLDGILHGSPPNDATISLACSGITESLKEISERSPSTDLLKKSLYTCYSCKHKASISQSLKSYSDDTLLQAALWIQLACIFPLVHSNSAMLLEEWELDRAISENLLEALPKNAAPTLSSQLHQLLRIAIHWAEPLSAALQNPISSPASKELLHQLFLDVAVHELLQINTFDTITYFHKEGFEKLLDTISLTACYLQCIQEEFSPNATSIFELTDSWHKAAINSEYRVDYLLQNVGIIKKT